MERVVVHVTTLDQWKSVLDIWHKLGYDWSESKDEYLENAFKFGGRFLFLDEIIAYSVHNTTKKPAIEYSEFMAQQKEDNKMKTYYVTQKQLDLIEELKNLPCPLVAIMDNDYGMITLYDELPLSDREWLRYLGGDETIEFKVKEQLYQLWRIDDINDKVYMKFTSTGNPDWTMDENVAFTAPLEEIEKHKTVSWEIEEAK